MAGDAACSMCRAPFRVAIVIPAKFAGTVEGGRAVDLTPTRADVRLWVVCDECGYSGPKSVELYPEAGR